MPANPRLVDKQDVYIEYPGITLGDSQRQHTYAQPGINHKTQAVEASYLHLDADPAVKLGGGVCNHPVDGATGMQANKIVVQRIRKLTIPAFGKRVPGRNNRSEERRVGKECVRTG